MPGEGLVEQKPVEQQGEDGDEQHGDGRLSRRQQGQGVKPDEVAEGRGQNPGKEDQGGQLQRPPFGKRRGLKDQGQQEQAGGAEKHLNPRDRQHVVGREPGLGQHVAGRPGDGPQEDEKSAEQVLLRSR